MGTQPVVCTMNSRNMKPLMAKRVMVRADIVQTPPVYPDVTELEGPAANARVSVITVGL